MHIWHHSKKPNKYGVNFGISLSVWDYIFKTNYIPKDGRDIELGFNDENEFPHDFIKQGLSLKNNFLFVRNNLRLYPCNIKTVTMKKYFLALILLPLLSCGNNNSKTEIQVQHTKDY
jgi:hypothetical protein